MDSSHAGSRYNLCCCRILYLVVYRWLHGMWSCGAYVHGAMVRSQLLVKPTADTGVEAVRSGATSKLGSLPAAAPGAAAVPPLLRTRSRSCTTPAHTEIMLRRLLYRTGGSAAALPPATSSSHRRAAALLLPLRPMSSVADGLDLGLPDKFDHFIGGEFVAPADDEYFDNISPIDGATFIKAARGSKADVDKAVAAAQAAYSSTWSKASVTERSTILLKVADVVEANADRLATIETLDNGKAIRESMAADIPLVVDHFRYFAGVIRAEEGSATEIDGNTVSLCIQEPLGVVGQIIPWNFPLLMAAWKIAPALAAGNCVVVKPAEQTPTSIMALMELLQDVVPPGVINVVTGYGAEAGTALASHTGIAKIGFTGSTATGTYVLKAAADNLIPATMELGGKSPNIFFSSIADKDDALLDKAVEGAVMFALNQGEVCTCQSRLLIQEDIYDQFMEKVLNATPIPMHTPSAIDSKWSLWTLTRCIWLVACILRWSHAPKQSSLATLWIQVP
jgi:aldehyde dehydrogenase